MDSFSNQGNRRGGEDPGDSRLNWVWHSAVSSFEAALREDVAKLQAATEYLAFSHEVKTLSKTAEPTTLIFLPFTFTYPGKVDTQAAVLVLKGSTGED